ncbi:MAG: hypothetical protein QM737_04330 [Ferruginibacter sp.]
MSMRSTRLVFLFIFFLFIKNSSNLLAQVGPVIKWQKCIGGSNEDMANDVLINPDGSYIVVGYTKSDDGDITGHHGTAGTADAFIAKLDTAGNIIWLRSIGGTGDDVFQTVIATNDNAYVCVGYTNSNDGDIINNHGNNDAWVVKINLAGNIIWNKCYGGTKADVAADVVLTPDGAYAIMGSCYSSDGDVASGQPDKPNSDGWAFKIDSNGTLAWETCVPGYNFQSIGYNITLSEDNNLYGFVSALESGPMGQDLYTPVGIYRINNAMGNLYGSLDAGGDSAFAVCRNADSLFCTYTDLTPSLVDYCYEHSTRINSKIGFNSPYHPPITVSYVASCNGGPPGFYTKFSKVHGIAADNNSLVCAGKSFTGNLGYPSGNAVNATLFTKTLPLNGSITGSNTKQYGGTGVDVFNSVKILPIGNEYITAGYTLSNDVDVSGNHGGADCWIVSLDGANIIKGNIFIDANNNGIRDAGELPYNGVSVKTSKQAFQVSGLPYNGVYKNMVDTGTFTTTVLPNLPYYTFTPASITSMFTTYKNTDTADFAMHAIPGIQDYSLSVIPLTRARPGFDLQYKIVYNNKGTTTLTDKNVTFIKDSRALLLGSVPLYTSVSGDTIRWNIASLGPTEGGNIILNLQLPPPPAINAGETIVSSALIDSTGDNTPVDNYSVITQNVTGSYDPNDKQENFGGELYPPDITAGKYLSYTIRFQNTGNDTAFNIIIRDTLDNKLKGDSVEFVGASHPYQASISENKYLKVSFADIRLVDSLHNEPLSHGYFSYRIKPTSTLVIGDTIKNTAYIYFDFNPPIKTNTQLTFVRPVPVNVLWTGAVSTAWEDQNNWGNHLVPDDKTNVLIESGLARYPIISSNAVCRSILVKTGSTVLVRTGFSFKVMH